MSTVSTGISRFVELDRTSSPWRPASGEAVVVYGAGEFARSVVEVLRQSGADVQHALDRRAGEASLDSIPVYPPNDDPLPPDRRRLTTAVVGVFNRSADPAEIGALLRRHGYGRVVHVPELYETFSEPLGERYWLSKRSTYVAQQHRIDAVAGMWHDAPSRELYRSLLRYRVHWDAANAPRPVPGHQYFPDDVPRVNGPMRFVDCGAFVGDTLSAVASIGARIEQVFAFEPDPENFAKLTAYTRDFARVTGGQVSLWPCAVTDETGPRRFRSSVGEASSLGTDGDDVVCGVALDDVLPTTAVTDLKMDIEGAELDALRGAERLIRRSCPRLAICVYHRAEHLWEIPLFVRALGLPYDFFLRSHGSGGFDVVMYAVPHATA